MLSEEANQAVERARAQPLNYGVRFLTAPDGRLLVIAGEAHLKLGEASQIGKQLVDAFELRGVETFPGQRVVAGGLLKILIHGPRVLLRLLSFGLVKDSTIRDAREAKTGTTFLLESVSPIPIALHAASIYMSAFFAVMFAGLVPFLGELLFPIANVFQWHLVALLPALLLQRHRWSWILHPMIAILTVRNVTMAEGTVAMLRENPGPRAALVIMGRAHLPGYERELVEKYGFTPA